VNQKYRAMVPRPSAADYRALEADIIAKGEATEPIVVNQNDVILDGHTRYEICSRNGCFYTTRTMTFDDPLEEQLYVITTNLYRRHLSDFKKVEMAKPLEKLLAAKAEQRQKRGTLASSEAKGKTSEHISKLIGVSPATYERAKKVRDEGSYELKRQVRAGEKSVHSAYREICRTGSLKKGAKKESNREKLKKILINDASFRLLISEGILVKCKKDGPGLEYYIVPGLTHRKMARLQGTVTGDTDFLEIVA